MTRTNLPVPGKDALYFLPLGGSGEIGMNLNLYGHAGKWLMVDLGVTFADESIPGVDVILPDPAAIIEQRENLVGLVVTHAHEDHLGAIQYLWPELRCPVYATPFAAAVLRAKLSERDFANKVPIIEIPVSGRFDVGPFNIEMIALTHSIPEPTALAIRTAAGNVLHTGDWKLDPNPLIGRTTDVEALTRFSTEGVLAMVCDSTNVLVPGTSGSEADVRDSLVKVFAQQKNRIAVTCFATNVARIASIAHAAKANGREVALVGRSLWRIYEAAKATGYLEGIPAFLTESDAGYVPREKIVLICTGSQGEPRSALARIAADDHPQIVLEEGDTVVFSSREIPGNEKAIGRVQNNLTGIGARIITPDDAFVHVSGHPAREELVQMYQWVRPKIAIPVHGEYRHMAAHAELAEECQVQHTIIPEDGTLIRLAPGTADIVDTIKTGRLALDGKRIVPLEGLAVRGRQRMMFNGAAVATLIVDRKGNLIADPQITAMGLDDSEPDSDTMLDVMEAVRSAVEKLPAQTRRQDDAAIRETARLAVRRLFNDRHGKKPLTEVQLIRI